MGGDTHKHYASQHPDPAWSMQHFSKSPSPVTSDQSGLLADSPVAISCADGAVRWMGDVGGRRSGLLFYSAGNVLGLLVVGARWYELSLYLMDVVLSLAGDVVRSLSAFCGVWCDFSLDILG
ncbi:uncharacterized protein LOC120352947 [Nilaparvata lugens]|uniref:uncharacterized protein LOC120352947 n=1 Tax=Nilaparvata lugens TaxID=108931 RepID=UPI00193E13BF|nr:uncharacterized protein LOC120352947 [Nilaparvata lugens]